MFPCRDAESVPTNVSRTIHCVTRCGNELEAVSLRESIIMTAIRSSDCSMSDVVQRAATAEPRRTQFCRPESTVPLHSKDGNKVVRLLPATLLLRMVRAMERKIKDAI